MIGEPKRSWRPSATECHDTWQFHSLDIDWTIKLNYGWVIPMNSNSLGSFGSSGPTSALRGCIFIERQICIWAFCSHFSQSFSTHGRQKQESFLTNKRVLSEDEFPMTECREREPGRVLHAKLRLLSTSDSPMCQNVRSMLVVVVHA